MDDFSLDAEVAQALGGIAGDLAGGLDADVALAELGGAGPSGDGSGDLGLVLDVPVELVVEMGRTSMTIRDALAIAPGTIITLDKMVGEPADLYVNGTPVARGEVVAVDEEFGLRVTEILPAERRTLRQGPSPLRPA
ncbi:MAG: flagellar motor switch protein FliN [Thermoleophilia bacterium]